MMKIFVKSMCISILLLITSSCIAHPRISLIASAWDPQNEFIEHFLVDFTQQSFFNEFCELIIINPNCKTLDEVLIYKYLAQYPNIVYVKLPYDPGVYGVWNMGIKIARGEYVANANLDDRRNPESLPAQMRALDENPEVDLVYSDYFLTHTPNVSFGQTNYYWEVRAPEFSLVNTRHCLPGPQPLWRKSMHEKYGYFDETFFASGDMKMWLQAVSKGAIFKKVPVVSGFYYYNPKGLSTDASPERAQRRNWEDEQIAQQYRYLWQ